MFFGKSFSFRNDASHSQVRRLIPCWIKCWQITRLQSPSLPGFELAVDGPAGALPGPADPTPGIDFVTADE